MLRKIDANAVYAATAIAERIGVDVSGYGHRSAFRDWETFFDTCELRDLLDAITVIYDATVAGSQPQWLEKARAWRDGCASILAEENLRYRLDARAGVRFHPDEEFARSSAGTLAALEAPRYANSAQLFEQGLNALAAAVPDGKTAIRSVFAATEGLFRLMFPDAIRLDVAEAGKRIEPLVQRQLASDPTAARASLRLLGAFRDWIDAAHFYRHEAGVEEPSQPPLTLAVHIVSVAAVALRWLAELDEFARNGR